MSKAHADAADEPAKKKPARRGRPRKAQPGKDGTRESIVGIAINLFYEKGFANTSLSEIARQMGMDPSSLYYYFPSKTALLESIFNPREMAPSLDALSAITPSRAEQLYALIVHDVVRKCELPFDFIEMETVANAEPGEFAAFFDSYRLFYLSLLEVIERGIEEGEFAPCEADERAVTILSVNEGLQHHFHAKHRGQLILETSGYTVRDHTPEGIGHLSAQAIMPSLMIDPRSFDALAERGRQAYYAMQEQIAQRA